MKAVSLLDLTHQGTTLQLIWNVFTKDKVTFEFIQQTLLDYFIYLEKGNYETPIDIEKPIYLTKLTDFRNYNIFKTFGIKRQGFPYSKNFFYEKFIPKIKPQMKFLGINPIQFYPVVFQEKSITNRVNLNTILLIVSKLEETSIKKPNLQFLTHKSKTIRGFTKCLENLSL